MKFVIQHNLMNDEQLRRTLKAVRPFPRAYVGLIPFSREITCDDPLDGVDYIPYGSTLLTNLTAELSWRGCHFDANKLNYENFVRNRSDMLNGEHIFDAEEAIRFLSNGMRGGNQRWFMRPSEDLKQFSGCVDDAVELVAHLRSMVDSHNRGEAGTYGISPATKVVLSSPKEISAEWRWFIVGGRIISGSMYRAHNQLRKQEEKDVEVVAEAQALADMWLPFQCVVMDTALIGDEVKVVEFNSINSSGFYDNDVDAIFSALWRYHEKL